MLTREIGCGFHCSRTTLETTIFGNHHISVVRIFYTSLSFPVRCRSEYHLVQNHPEQDSYLHPTQNLTKDVNEVMTNTTSMVMVNFMKLQDQSEHFCWVGSSRKNDL